MAELGDLKPWPEILAEAKKKNPLLSQETIDRAHKAYFEKARQLMGPMFGEEVKGDLNRGDLPPPYAPADQPPTPGSAADAERRAAAAEPPPKPKPEVEGLPHKALRAFRYVESLAPVERPIAEGVRKIERPFEWAGGKVTQAIDPLRARHAVAGALARRGV